MTAAQPEAAVTAPPFAPAGLAPGDVLPDFVSEPLTRTDFVRYQGASGDMNPIHHDDDFARTAGYPTVFAVGMLAAGVLGSRIADLFGPENVRRFRVRFREQAWPGDVLTYRVAVREHRDAEGAAEIDLECSVTRQSGHVHLTGAATVLVAGEQEKAGPR